jgi:hypothetical protein
MLPIACISRHRDFALQSLKKLSLHGNRLKDLPCSLRDLDALQELWLMVRPPSVPVSQASIDKLATCFNTTPHVSYFGSGDVCLIAGQ